MNPKFLDVLRCPITGARLALTIQERFSNGMVRTGILTTTDGARKYSVIGGIPRFLDAETYAASFGYEWKKWSSVQYESQNVGRPMAGHTTRMFEAITGLSGSTLEGKYVVEFGCGGGRFLDVVRKKGGIAVGIDMSAAVEPAREHFKDDPDVLVIQGDILKPPVAMDAFDIGYSMGVLHHTPRPAEGLRQLAKVVKRGGLIACSVYPNEGFYAYSSVRRYRRLINALRSKFGAEVATKIALSYSYFAASVLYYVFLIPRRLPYANRLVRYLESRILVNLSLPDWRWRVLDVFDAITPAYASTHTADEVQQWFEIAKCIGIRQMPWGPTSFVGVKA